MARGQVVEQNGAETEDENGEVSNGTKRERVDLATLANDEKVIFSFYVPAEMKRQMIKAGEDSDKTATAWARDVLAERLEYQIPASFAERTRTTKYGSEEERKAALAERGKQQRAAVKDLLSKVKGNAGAAEALAAMGIDLEALGVKA